VIYSSYEVLLLFPTFLVLFYSARTALGQNIFLLITSVGFLAFAGAWNLLPVAFVIFSVSLYRHCDRRRASNHWDMTVIIVLLLINLSYFKYRGLLASGFGIHLLIPDALALVIPLGISFYTFEAISAVIDLRHRKITVTGIDWPLFIMFFPHLIAGPIIRFHQLKSQFDYKKVFCLRNIGIGLQLFTVGFVKKLAADPLGQLIDPVWSAPRTASASALALALVGFYIQLYLDFSGYTDMGRGIARMMGYRLPVNFRGPYLAVTPGEFYQRWHVTLSNWIRVFVFDTMSLAVLRRVRNRKLQNYALLLVVLVVMALFGLWHGGAWHYIIFGVLQGFVIITWTAVTGGRRPKTMTMIVISTVLLQASWAASLIFFRADNLPDAAHFIGGLFSPGGHSTDLLCFVLPAFIGTLAIQAVDYSIARRPIARSLIMLRSTGFGLLLMTIVLACAMWLRATLEFHHLTTGEAGTATAPFIYFNF
jgi:alginate O-acetyltransferase complex protein AlgI